MTTLEAGAFIGIAGGTIAGAILCNSHGVPAEIAGAIAGGTIGFFAGIALVFLRAVAGLLAKNFWEILTGRRKLPPISETPESHRRRLLGFIIIICVLAELILAGIYFDGTPAQHSRAPFAAALIFAASVIALLLLTAFYRRHPAQKNLGIAK
jgi:hypothetical protein